jgi:hypothetical protein
MIAKLLDDIMRGHPRPKAMNALVVPARKAKKR